MCSGGGQGGRGYYAIKHAQVLFFSHYYFTGVSLLVRKKILFAGLFAKIPQKPRNNQS